VQAQAPQQPFPFPFSPSQLDLLSGCFLKALRCTSKETGGGTLIARTAKQLPRTLNVPQSRRDPKFRRQYPSSQKQVNVPILYARKKEGKRSLFLFVRFFLIAKHNYQGTL